MNKICGLLTILILPIFNSCNNKKSLEQELVLNFNSYTFETLEGEHRFEGTDFPTLNCNSTFTFYSNKSINVNLDFTKPKSIANTSFKWLSKKENIENNRIWTGYKLDKNESGYYALSIRKNLKNQIIAVSMTDDRMKIVYFDK